MKLDNEQQKKVLLEIINNTNFSGDSIEFMFNLKKSIQEAEVETTTQQEDAEK